MSYAFVSQTNGNAVPGASPYVVSITEPAGLANTDIVVLALDLRCPVGVGITLLGGFNQDGQVHGTNSTIVFTGIRGEVGAGPYNITVTWGVALRAHWAGLGYSGVINGTDASATQINGSAGSVTSTYTSPYTDSLHLVSWSGNDPMAMDGALTQRVYNKDAAGVTQMIGDEQLTSSTVPARTEGNIASNWNDHLTIATFPASAPAGDAWAYMS